LSRNELDTGAHGDNSTFWKLVEKRFDEGFPTESCDGPVFASVVHFDHPNITNYHEAINPGVHGQWTAGDLRKMWKDIQSDYDTVMTKFTASGNHNSSFTKAAMILETGNEEDIEEENDDDCDDVFGVEEKGFCCFTNSIVIIYLQMWMNARPGMTGFVSRKVPKGMQIDASLGSESDSNKPPRSSPETAGALVSAAIKELANAKNNKTMKNAEKRILLVEKTV